jgi:hypothetical protein
MSSHFRVGLGDHTAVCGSEVEWEEVKLLGARTHGFYRWELDADGDWRRGFRWERRKGRKWVYVDGEGGEMLATWEGMGFKGWKKVGEFGFMKEMGERWERMAVLVMLGIYEKARRRDWWEI